MSTSDVLYNRLACPSFLEIAAQTAEEGGIRSCTYTFTEMVQEDWVEKFPLGVAIVERCAIQARDLASGGLKDRMGGCHIPLTATLGLAGVDVRFATRHQAELEGRAHLFALGDGVLTEIVLHHLVFVRAA